MAAFIGSNLDIDGTAEQLTATSRPFTVECWIKASPGNSTNIIYVGLSSDVTAGTADATDGYPLAAGEEMVIPAEAARNANAIYVIGSTTNLKAHFMCY